jgi:hypothetical protein
VPVGVGEAEGEGEGRGKEGGKEGLVLRFAHCSCKSTGRDGVGFDAVWVPTKTSTGCTMSKQSEEEEKEDEGEEEGQQEGPRPPPECAGNPVAEHYARRFLGLGRVERGVAGPEDVIWRVRTSS